MNIAARQCEIEANIDVLRLETGLDLEPRGGTGWSKSLTQLRAPRF